MINKVFDLVITTQANKHEIEFIKAQQSHTEAKNKDTYIESQPIPMLDIPSKYRKIDKLNQMLRPITVLISLLLIIGIFVATIVIIFSNPTIQVSTAISLLNGGLVGDLILSVIGFLFGQRAIKR